MFFYVMHILLVNLIEMVAVVMSGYSAWTMVLDTWVNFSQDLVGYGFGLPVVYVVWIAVVIILYPISRWYERYKMANRGKVGLSYV